LRASVDRSFVCNAVRHCKSVVDGEFSQLCVDLSGSRRKLVDELSSGDEGQHNENERHATALPAMDTEEVTDVRCQELYLSFIDNGYFLLIDGH